MKKIRTSLACPECKSSNVESRLEFVDITEEETIYFEKEAVKKTGKRVYKCRCNNCLNEYIVDYGTDTYVVFKNPCAITNMNDVQLHALYKSESEKDFKIISIDISSYDEHKEQQEPTYLLLSEGDELPMVITKETAIEFSKTLSKAQNFIYDNNMSRYR